jgi:hypothetical protein
MQAILRQYTVCLVAAPWWLPNRPNDSGRQHTYLSIKQHIYLAREPDES